MKKKLVIGVLIAVLAVGMVMAFTACGVNGSPASVVKAYIESDMNFDLDKMIDVTYFENDDLKETYEKYFEESINEIGENVNARGKITKFEFKEEESTEEEFEIAKAMYEGVNIEEICKFTVTYSGTATISATVNGEEMENTLTRNGVTGSGMVYKIDGKWYYDIVVA